MSEGAGRVAGKTALVTGAAGGLGLASAALLVKHGATVYITDLAQDRGEAAAQSIGSIVNLSSVAALMATPFITPYGVSKAGVAHLSRNVAMYCATAGYRIRCNSIHPGQIDTDMHRQGLRDFALSMGVDEEEVRGGFLQKIPLGEFGEPDDIAYAVLYLASDESKHVTGTQLVVDGGMTLNG